MTTNPLRLEAARLIQEFGFAKGQYRDANGCFCMVGALRTADRGLGKLHSSNSIEVINAIEEMGFFGTAIIHYNDAPERTKEEVIARLLA